jgi:predicted AlkP superfamily pyrophosphatase or phosphodiesterase
MFPHAHVPDITWSFGSDNWFPRSDEQVRQVRDWVLRSARTEGLSDEDIERADVAFLAKLIDAQYPGGFDQFAVDHRSAEFGGPGGSFRP